MIHANRQIEWGIEDAEVQIGDDVRFSNCDLELVIRKQFMAKRLVGTDIDGTFHLTHPLPEPVFFDEDDVPKCRDAVFENDEKKIEIEGMLVTTEGGSNKAEFVATDAEQTVFNEQSVVEVSKLEEVFAEHWSPKRVLTKCDECGVTLFDTDETQPTIWKPSYMATLIKTLACQHEAQAGHRSLDIEIDESSAVREIDCTITVGDS